MYLVAVGFVIFLLAQLSNLGLYDLVILDLGYADVQILEFQVTGHYSQLVECQTDKGIYLFQTDIRIHFLLNSVWGIFWLLSRITPGMKQRYGQNTILYTVLILALGFFLPSLYCI